MSSGEEPEHGTSLPLAISHAEMNARIDEGDAAPLSQSHGWLARYRDAWWVEYEGGWLRVIDAAAARELDQVAARLAEVSAITAAGAGEPINGQREHADGSDGPADGQRPGMEPVRVQRHPGAEGTGGCP